MKINSPAVAEKEPIVGHCLK